MIAVGVPCHRMAAGSKLAQESEPLGAKLHVHSDDTGEVAARLIEARDQAGLDWVVAGAEDDGDCRGRSFGRACRSTVPPPVAAMTLTPRPARSDANSGSRS